MHFCKDLFSAFLKLKRNLPRHDVPPHAPVTDKAEARVFKSSRPVVLKKEMPDPGEGVTLYQRDQNQPPDLREQRRDEQGQGDAGAHKIQPPRHAVGMFAQIERVEVGEGADAGLGGHEAGLFPLLHALARKGPILWEVSYYCLNVWDHGGPESDSGGPSC